MSYNLDLAQDHLYFSDFLTQKILRKFILNKIRLHMSVLLLQMIFKFQETSSQKTFLSLKDCDYFLQTISIAVNNHKLHISWC